MRQHEENLLNTAVEAIKSETPDSTELGASAARVAARLGIDTREETRVDSIHNCDDVQHLLNAYRAGTLPADRALLVEAHLHECAACTRRYKQGSSATVLDWSAPKSVRPSVWKPRTFGMAIAASLAFLVCGLFVYRAYWQVPPGVRAEVQSIDGSAYRISDAGSRALLPGESLNEGDQVRTAGGSRAVLRLSDGSRIEVNERSVLAVGARGKNMTLSLDDGAVIVEAAKRTSGHLYLKTPDCRVAVTGTVFSVDAGIKGSRVAVLQGTVHVEHGGVDSELHAGDEVATSDKLAPAPLDKQFAWSHDREKYLPLLAALSALRNRLDTIPFPESRFSSDLLERVPADTVVYVSVPNLGDFLSQANTVFQDQLKQSPELQQWLNKGKDNNGEQMNAIVNKLHDLSTYVGNEVVIVGFKRPTDSGFAVIADVKKDGLGDQLKAGFPELGVKSSPFIVLTEETLNSAAATDKGHAPGYALIRAHEAVFSNSIATLKQVNTQLNAGNSGFATGDFGKQVAAAYTRGAGIVVAADLHQLIGNSMKLATHHSDMATEAPSSGFEDIRYLIAEHRETNGVPENHLNLQFSGTRQHVASWLAAPAPMASLDFVSPNAAVAVSVLTKDPKSIADDIISMTQPGEKGQGDKEWTKAQAMLQVDLRSDIIANLGGDFLVALDGPVLPTPSWRAVIEVHDTQRLETALEKIAQVVSQKGTDKNKHNVVIEPSRENGQQYYAVHDMTSGAIVANYTYADGYMIIAPSRALLIQALQTHSSGDSLAHSQSFKALLPKDENNNYSAIAYQNLGPVLTPLLSQFQGKTADAIKQLAADSRPTAVCAWGRDTRIEVASDSRLFGFDFLTLGALMNSGNKPNPQPVKQ